MAEPSRAGWHGIPAAKRFCAFCSRKLTLKEPGGLWFSEATGEVFHSACRLLAWKRERLAA